MVKGRKLGLVGLVTVAIAKILGGGADANAIDTLKVYNSKEGSLGGQVTLMQKEGAIDGYKYDTPDSDRIKDINETPIGSSELGSVVDTYLLRNDSKALGSTTPFNLLLFYNGTLTDSISNWITFEFGADHFGSQEIILDSDNLKYGKRVNVRNAIANNSGVVEMNDLPAGTYVTSVPYASGKLTIGTEPLAELNNDDIVDFKDYAILTQNWMAPQGKYAGDISGPNGIPDGYVNMYDLEAFCDDWMQ